MKVSRNVIWLTLGLSIISIALCYVLEFAVSDNLPHRGFYLDLGMGIVAGAFLAMLTALVQYLKERHEHFFMIHAYLKNIKIIVSSGLSEDETYLARNIRNFAKLEEMYQSMVLHKNDFHTLMPCGFYCKQIKNVEKLMHDKRFYFWSKYNNADKAESYMLAFRSAKGNYQEMEEEIDKVILAYDNHVKS